MAAVLGRNGAGKTTFIRCIADLIPHQGSIVLEEDGKKLDPLQLRIYRSSKR